MDDQFSPDKYGYEKDRLEWEAKQAREKQESLTAQKVIIKGIDIPFWGLVSFFIRAGLAAIPATIVLSLISVFIFFFFLRN